MSEELVVDASAVADALIRGDEVGNALAQRISGSVCHSPHLIDAEVGSVLRRAERRGLINERTALTSLRLLKFLIDERYSHDGWLALEAWKLRGTVTFYDGLYVALAARLDIPLLTRDIKLSKAPGLPCRIEVCG
ncbi:MAG: type II toxin-antitoxin system VapC family toxin [Nocardia sp.]|nr:type II toxin-antitoxin system VapC family toxin [Nocardia sp.]